jgi:hypothetical protein
LPISGGDWSGTASSGVFCRFFDSAPSFTYGFSGARAVRLLAA